MIAAEFKIDEFALERVAEPMRIRIVRDALRNSISLLAKAPPLDAGRFQIVPKIVKSQSDWHNSKWARFVRWALSKRILRRLVPYPLECLAFAESISRSYDRVELSESVWSAIHAQIAELKLSGKEPSKILIGCSAFEGLEKTLNFSMMSPMWAASSQKDAGLIAGIPAELSYKITPNSVLVV